MSECLCGCHTKPGVVCNEYPCCEYVGKPLPKTTEDILKDAIFETFIETPVKKTLLEEQIDDLFDEIDDPNPGELQTERLRQVHEVKISE